jgi:hypothetical protein
MHLNTHDRELRQALNYGPVKLTYADQPMWSVPGRPGATMLIERFATNRELLARATVLFKGLHFHNVFVTDSEEQFIWTDRELRARCEGPL